MSTDTLETLRQAILKAKAAGVTVRPIGLGVIYSSKSGDTYEAGDNGVCALGALLLGERVNADLSPYERVTQILGVPGAYVRGIYGGFDGWTEKYANNDGVDSEAYLIGRRLRQEFCPDA